MKRKLIAILLSACLLASLLAGCRASANIPKNFIDRIESQEALTLDLFKENYAIALDLYTKGARAESKMPEFKVKPGFDLPAQDAAPEDGFYVVHLDKEIFGVANFFVIPAGLRALTAEEYLQLVEASAQMPVDELLKEENSFIPLAGERENKWYSRNLTPSENRWGLFMLGQVLRGKGEKAPADFPVALPAPTELGYYLIYPTGHMSVGALQGSAALGFKMSPADAQAANTPPEDGWDSAIQAAQEAVAHRTGIDGQPSESYAGFMMHGDSPYWMVALYYADGGSYQVYLEGNDLMVTQVDQMTDGYFDINGDSFVRDDFPRDVIASFPEP